MSVGTLRPEEDRVAIEHFLKDIFGEETRIADVFPSHAGLDCQTMAHKQLRALYLRLGISTVPLLLGLFMFLRVFPGVYEPVAGGLLIGVALMTSSIATITYGVYKRREFSTGVHCPVQNEYLGVTAGDDLLIAQTHLFRETTTYRIPAILVDLKIAEDELDEDHDDFIKIGWVDDDGSQRIAQVCPIDDPGFIAAIRDRRSKLHTQSPHKHRHHNRNHHKTPPQDSSHAAEHLDQEDVPVSAEAKRSHSDALNTHVVVPIPDL